MLERIAITGFAVARSVVVVPGPGLNVFTGETGAGKSLVVDALAFVFGARRGREVIATGAERAVVEATLLLPEGPVVLERTIGLSGRSTARLNGEPATIEQLQALGERAVDIHGQSDHLAILRPANQLAALDAFAGLEPHRQRVAGLVRELREVRREARALRTDERERERLIGQLRFESEEIDAAELVPGEDGRLRQDQSRLANASKLLESAAQAIEDLEGAPLPAVAGLVHDLVTRDPTASELADLATLLESTAEDLARGLRHYRDSVEEDPARLDSVQERLDLIARLRRKYGESVDDILAYGRDAAVRLAALTGTGASLEALEAREAGLLAELSREAQALSEARRGSAGDLVRAIAAELEQLGMGGSALSVGFACEDAEDGVPVTLPDYEVVITERPSGAEEEAFARAFTESGVDRVEFLASFNEGEAPRPLSGVASGGETSRFLLALTTVLGAAAEPRLVVLDEVDEGVGGRAGALVGAALERLAARHQVLCITHLPQVAAFGERHFVVTKQVEGGATHSAVVEVAGAARIDELASMLGGVTEANQRAAAELLVKESRPSVAAGRATR
ncbi:MAG: DNA repair protein RecN [Dehalococcoidia bacterium]